MHALQLCVPVREITQVGEARRAAAKICASTGFDATCAGRVAIVVTELATNLVRHGGGGELLLQTLGEDPHFAFEALAIDKGPGMQLDRCLADGYSTGGTSGTGLGSVRRQSDEFDAWSRPSAGSVLLSRVLRQVPRGQPAPPADFEIGAVQRPYPGELVCGDGWSVRENAGQLTLQVVDGLGHGEPAAQAAHAAAACFAAEPPQLPGALLEQMHRGLSGTRGAALAIAAIHSSGSLYYAGVGNIAGSLIDDGVGRGLVSHSGIVGVQVRKVQQFEYPCQEGSMLVMHSDGLQARWRLDGFEGLRHCHPGVIAAMLYREFRRERDDLIVVVVRRRRA